MRIAFKYSDAGRFPDGFLQSGDLEAVGELVHFSAADQIFSKIEPGLTVDHGTDQLRRRGSAASSTSFSCTPGYLS